MSSTDQNAAQTSSSALDEVRESGVLRTPTVARIHVDRLRHNVAMFQRVDADLMAVVKADAYGHGASRVARELSNMGVQWFAVATAAEGMKLRRAGIDERILVFAAPLPQHLSAYPQYDLDVTVSSASIAEEILSGAFDGNRFRVHVKVDTGMGRIGLPLSDASWVIRKLEQAPRTEIAGIWTHLATADEPDLSFAHEQLERFAALVDDVGDAAEHIHVANSAAALRLAESVSFPRPMVRCGIGLYGYTALDGLAEEHGLRPVMDVSSRVTHVKTVDPGTSVSYGRRWTADRRTRIATVGAGYADGYHRLLSNRSNVAIRGSRYPVVGSVCMDMFMVDIGPDGEVDVDDDVLLFGAGGPTAHDAAAWAETIPYEVLTSVSQRVPRVYV